MDKKLEQCVRILKEFGATDIYLFGSVARNQATPTSDIDLAVRGISGDKLFAILGQLEDWVESNIDLVLLDEESAFTQHIEEKISRGLALSSL